MRGFIMRTLVVCLLLFTATGPAQAVDHLFHGWTDINAERILSPATGKGGANSQYLGDMLRRAFYSTAASTGLYTVADRTALAAITKATLTATTALPGVTELVVRVTSDADSKPRRYRWKASDSTTETDYVLATGEGGTGRWFALIDDVTDTAAAGILDADFAGTFAGAMIRTGSAAYAVLKHNLAGGAAPAATDDGPTNGYAVGSLWIDTTSSPKALYMAVAIGDDAAVWHLIGNGTEVLDADFSSNGALERTGAGAYTVRALVSTSAGAGDSGKLPILNGSGVLAISFVGDDTVTNAKLATTIKIGALADLTTSATNTIVAAINELVSDIGAVAVDAASALASISAAVTDTGVGVGNAGKLVELDGSGLLDGRDIATDGALLDTLSGYDFGTTRDVEYPVSLNGTVAEAGTWTAAGNANGSLRITVSRTPGAGNADAVWYGFSDIYRTGASHGISFSGARVHYFLSIASADDVRFEFYRLTTGANGSSGTSTAVGGTVDGHYDTDHDTAGERATRSGDPTMHTATITFPAAVQLLTGESLQLRVFVNGDAGGSAAFGVMGVFLIGAEDLVD